MANLSASIFKILTYSFIICVASLSVAFLISLVSETSSIGTLFGTVGIFSFVVSVYAFLAHVFSFIVIALFKKKS
jgi:hypothetical protein